MVRSHHGEAGKFLTVSSITHFDKRILYIKKETAKTNNNIKHRDYRESSGDGPLRTATVKLGSDRSVGEVKTSDKKTPCALIVQGLLFPN